MNPMLTIGALARDTGAGVQTLRYYERRGLLSKVSRSAAGYRLFAPTDVQRVRFIRHAQTLGFTLDEIRDLLALRVKNGRRCDGVRRAALSTRERVRDRLVNRGNYHLIAVTRREPGFLLVGSPATWPRIEADTLELLDDVGNEPRLR